jgi:nucleoside-diphosphate-sugar epimerase
LLDRGIEVVTFDLGADMSRLSLITGASEWKGLETRTGRIEDAHALPALVREGGITHIVHLAAVLMPFCRDNPVQGALINVIGTLNVFQAARDAGRPVRVVYASSSAVWGPEEAYGERSLRESDPLLPGTHYGVFKMANEHNARVFHQSGGISSAGLRPWTVYGAGRDNGLTADPTLALKAVAEKRPFQIRVSGFMDLQYAGDVAEAFVRAALDGPEGAHVYNLAGDIVSMENLVSRIDALRPGAARLLSITGPQVPVSFHMDATALHEAVPGIPRTPLDSGLARTLEIFERPIG